ncbi:DUF3987 domain-containing protein [Kitasatospora sp. NPDC101157]|uniref:DUF3987 domain-containing protein n=1 Tax=Kitasatospora sp. NPDC101157 TaxID=3364098 RepID=UPI00381D3A70
MSTITLYGPIGRAVEKVSPYVECDPVGIYVAALSMWSAAIGQTVKVSSRGNARPALVWSALIGGTGKGKGTALRSAQHIMKPALGRFLETHTTSGITSGASLVNYLAEQVEATEETEAGRDVRALVIEEEWSEVLRRVRRDTSFTAKLRSAWDGAPIRNTTKAEAQSVEDPAVVFHAHITPSDWTKYIGPTEAAGGSYNRIMPFALASVPMLDDDGATLPDVNGWDLTQAYYWAADARRVISLGEDARPLWKTVRRYARIVSENLPEAQAVYVERTAEQTIRVAACLAASEQSEVIDHACLSAAFSLVRYSVRCAVSITGGAAGTAKPARRVPTLAEKVRARIEMHGGKAKSSELLPYVGASADEVKALPGVKVTLDRSGLGRPATVYTLAEEDAGHAPLSRPRTQRDERPATVVRMDTYRPAKTTPPTPMPAPAPRPQPVASGNPFLALL